MPVGFTDIFVSCKGGLKYAAERDLGIVVMEPLRGGLLSWDVPAIRERLQHVPVRRTPSEWGLHWVWNHPEVTVVLSGMNAMEQVDENLACAEQAGPAIFPLPRRACRCRNNAGHVCLPREDPVHRLPLLHAVQTRAWISQKRDRNPTPSSFLCQ